MRRRCLALVRSHCLVQMATRKARMMTMTATSHGTCMSHSLTRVHHGTAPTVIDLRTDPERLELGSMQNGNRAGDIAGLLHLHERVHEGFESGSRP